MSLAPILDSIVLFGDSITQGGWEAGGFAQKLAHVYCRKMDVINRGLSGYNTEWAIPVFKKMFSNKTEGFPSHAKCKLLTIWFGANDACLPPSPQTVPLDRFKANLEWMVWSLRTSSSEYCSPWTRIILLTPPPVQVIRREKILAERDPPREIDRSFDRTRAYAETVKEVGVTHNISVVDAWTAIWTAAGQKESALTPFLSDGLHLTDEGYAVVYEELIKVVARDFPELHYGRLPQVFPPWDTIDPENPKGSVVSQYVDV